MTTWLRFIWLRWWETLNISHDRVKFDTERSGGIGDKGFYFVIRHHVATWVNLSHHSAKFDAYRSSQSGDITFLFCYVTSRDQMTKGTCGLLSLLVVGLVEVNKYIFKKFAHWFPSLNVNFENSVKVRLTYFNISVGVNAEEIIITTPVFISASLKNL